MQRLSRFRWQWIALTLAFILNALLPFYASYGLPASHAQAGAVQTPSAFGDKILLCTVEGFKWVNLQDLASGKQIPKPHPDYKCPVCYALAHGIKQLTGQSITLALPGIAISTGIASHALQIAVASGYATHHSRAPPFSVLA